MAKGGKQHLKSALQSQQSRLKAKQKLSQAAQVLQQKAKRNNNNSKGGAQQNVASGSGLSQAKGKGKEKATSTAQPSTARPTVPFKPTDKILLIGEGNFSFARALVIDSPPEITHMPPGNITATTYDSEEDCYSKYTDAQEIVEGLRDKGMKVFFGVDGTRLDRAAGIKGKKFDRIVFNFPHAGKGISDQDRNILSNQMLILGFLSSASRFLVPGPIPVTFQSRKRKRSDDEEESGDDDGGSEDEDAMDLSGSTSALARGTVLITLRNVVPYTQWDVPRLAKNPPPPQTASAPPYSRYILLRSFKFHGSLWKGYEHKMTKGERAHGTGKTGEGGEDRTWEFYLSDVNSDKR